MFINLVFNIALIISLVTALNLIVWRLGIGSARYQIISGFLFGGVILIGMRYPVEYMPGVFFDGRSIVLAIAGLFGGPITAAIAAIMAIAYRIWLGGAGMIVGTFVIVWSAGIGIIWYYLRPRFPASMRFMDLLGLGLLVHLGMLGLMLALPQGLSGGVISQIALPVLTIYPLGTLLIALLFIWQEHRVALAEELRKSEGSLKRAQQIAHVGSWEWNLADSSFQMSEEMHRIYGVSENQSFDNIRDVVDTFIHPDDRLIVKKAQETVAAKFAGEPIEYRITRPDGAMRWISATPPEVRRTDKDGKPVAMIGTIHDITERKQAEARIEHLNLILRAIRNINQLVTREKNRDRLLQGACEILVHVRDYRFAWIGLIEEGHKRVLPVAQAGFEEGYLGSIKVTWDDTTTGKGPTGTAIKTRQPSVMNNTSEDPRFEPWREEALKRGYRSSVAIPLVHGEKVYGALNVYSSERDGFNDEEIRLLLEVCSDLALALRANSEEEERKKAQQALVERVKELQCLYSISNSAQKAGITLDEIYQEATNQLPSSWQYPEITCARITFGDKEFKTDNFKPTEWGRSANINVDGQKQGTVEAYYLEEKPEIDEGPFLEEKRDLVNAVAEMLGGITERKKAEEKTRQVAEEWRTTFDSIGDLISIHDKDFKLVRVNKAFANSLNMKPEELVGKTCYQMIHGATEPVSSCPNMKALETKEPAIAEFFEPHLGIHLEVTASPILNDKGEILASVHVARDVTERKKMQAQLLTNDRLASIGELVSGIAHELNNPLTSVIGFSDLLAGRKDLPDDIKEDIELINGEAQRTANIVKNLLTFARKQPKEKQLTDINKAIEAVIELRAYEQKVSNVQVNTQFASDLPEIMANSFDLQQVFLNIMVNAEHAMLEAHGKGTVTITTEREGDIIRVSLTNDGPGISEEHIGHVFDPFFTTKEVGKGTGLGLSICYGTITDHGGRIYVESEPGKGATFIIDLPVVTTDNGGTKNENS